MTPSVLKQHVEAAGMERFFARGSMKFFGDTMRNYGVRSAVIQSLEGQIDVWELYRKQPVKHGNQGSTYFCKQTFRKVYPVPL